MRNLSKKNAGWKCPEVVVFCSFFFRFFIFLKQKKEEGEETAKLKHGDSPSAKLYYLFDSGPDAV